MVRHDLLEVVAIEAGTHSPWSEIMVDGELAQGSTRLVYVVEKKSSTGLQHIVGWYTASNCFPEAELLKITVQHENRSQGIGQMLLQHLIDNLTKSGYTSLFLEVRSQNIPALKLYKKNGFLQIGRRNRYYKNPSDDALLFRKYLAPKTT